MKNIEERIKAALARNPDYPNSRIAKNLNNVCSSAEVQRIRESLPTFKGAPSPEASPSTGAKGVPLQSKRVTSFRPVETAAKFIKRLPKGRGFTPKDLAAEWGMSEETIKRHAKDMKCLKYVEIAEDEWVPMIMHPETAALY